MEIIAVEIGLAVWDPTNMARPHDLKIMATGAIRQTAYTMNPAIPNSVAAIGRSVGSAQIAGEVPDQVTPCCRSQVSALG